MCVCMKKSLKCNKLGQEKKPSEQGKREGEWESERERVENSSPYKHTHTRLAQFSQISFFILFPSDEKCIKLISLDTVQRERKVDREGDS